MKKYFSYLLFALMAVFPLSFVSCGDDDEEETKATYTIDYLEVTIDGTTKKVEIMAYSCYTGHEDKDGNHMEVISADGHPIGRLGTISAPIAVYQYKSDFDMKPGSYIMKTGRYALAGYHMTLQPFDMSIDYWDYPDTAGGQFYPSRFGLPCS